MSPHHTPIPFTHLSDLYTLMGPEALLAHIQAAAAALAATGVEITADAQRGLDELAESVVEHHARHDPAALARHLAAAEAALAATPSRVDHSRGSATAATSGAH